MTEETTVTKPKRGRPKKQAETAEAPVQEEKKVEVEAQPDLGIIHEEATQQNEMRRRWHEERQMVKGVFRMHEPEGGNVIFTYRKYKWDPVQKFELFDGQEYEIPLGVARHLNSQCQYAVHQHILDAQGNPAIDRQGRKKKRMSFESLEFL